MASKKEIIKDPELKAKLEEEDKISSELYEKMRNYCNAPWVSTRERLPEPKQLVLMAYYIGEEDYGDLCPGFAMCCGYMTKASDAMYAYLMDNKGYSDAFYYGYSTNFNSHLRGEDETEDSPRWIRIGDNLHVFHNTKAADKTYLTGEELLAKRDYTFNRTVEHDSNHESTFAPDFWMPIPQIK